MSAEQHVSIKKGVIGTLGHEVDVCAICGQFWPCRDGLQRDLAAAQALLARRETSWIESQAKRDRLVSRLTAERDAAQARVGELSRDYENKVWEVMEWMGKEEKARAEARALREALRQIAGMIDPEGLGSQFEALKFYEEQFYAARDWACEALAAAPQEPAPDAQCPDD